jgi:hypothetical protein
MYTIIKQSRTSALLCSFKRTALLTFLNDSSIAGLPKPGFPIWIKIPGAKSRPAAAPTGSDRE